MLTDLKSLAAERGHAMRDGSPALRQCVCGYEADGAFDLDEHIISAAVGNEPDHAEKTSGS